MSPKTCSATKPGIGKVGLQRERCRTRPGNRRSGKLAQNVAPADPSFGKVGTRFQCLVIGGEGLAVAPEFVESIATSEPRVDKTRVQRQRLVVGGGSFIVAPERTKGIAATEPGVGEIRAKIQRLVVGSKGFVVSSKPAVEDGLVQKRLDGARIDGLSAFDAGKRLVILIHSGKDGGSLVVRGDMFWLQHEKLIELCEQLLKPIEFEQCQRVHVQ